MQPIDIGDLIPNWMRGFSAFSLFPSDIYLHLMSIFIQVIALGSEFVLVFKWQRFIPWTSQPLPITHGHLGTHHRLPNRSVRSARSSHSCDASAFTKLQSFVIRSTLTSTLLSSLRHRNRPAPQALGAASQRRDVLLMQPSRH